jgi:hypothetical protein
MACTETETKTGTKNRSKMAAETFSFELCPVLWVYDRGGQTEARGPHTALRSFFAAPSVFDCSCTT